MRITAILIGSAALALAACTPAKEQAIAECEKQSESLPDQVDADRFCACITEKIPDDASVEEAKQVLQDQAQACTMEQVQNIMQGMAPPTSEAPAAPAGE